MAHVMKNGYVLWLKAPFSSHGSYANQGFVSYIQKFM